MILTKPTNRKYVVTFLILSLFSFIKISAQDGRALFNSNCASCHNVFKVMAAPALRGFEERGPWSDRQQLYSWIHNPAEFKKRDQYAANLSTQFQQDMQAFPTMPEKDIDAIVDYIITTPDPTVKPAGDNSQTTPTKNQNWIIFGIISLIMAIIAMILMHVNSNLKKLSDDKEGVLRPEPVPFYKNKVYIALVTIVFFIMLGFYATKAGIGLGRQKDLQPEQPIFYSHKVHAGINQISCLYCHGNAWESRTAAIPSVNVCMNCHKAITEYTKGPQLYDGNGNEINGTTEIQKLFKYAGFDPANADRWDPSKAKAIPWERIHNLPDHVYFNHSQHVRAGNVQCQTCHGAITEMDEVKQFSELSMGWCINCHRETKVNFNYSDSTGNKFYSIYEKFHNDIKAGRMDSVTVKDIGGLECQKCHY